MDVNAANSRTHIVQYVIYTYGLFGLLLLGLGGIATKLLNGTPLVMRWLTAITAWTPTYVLLLMFRRLYPNSTVKAFYRRAFSAKINLRLLVATTAIQILAFALSMYMISVQRGVAITSLLDFSFPTVISALFFIPIQGPMGEESGWRGYLLPAIESKVGVVKGSLVVSLIWSLWHAPIWFLSAGYSGTVLVQYVTAYFICIASVGFLIGICYHHCKNLVVPILIHFMLNFCGQMFTGSMLELVSWYAAFYFIIAVGFFLWHRGRHVRRDEMASFSTVA
jgi:membrane protease YdiL (CAAX protease family)